MKFTEKPCTCYWWRVQKWRETSKTNIYLSSNSKLHKLKRLGGDDDQKHVQTKLMVKIIARTNHLPPVDAESVKTCETRNDIAYKFFAILLSCITYWLSSV